ncbi:hypothetical protein G6F46_014370 [Rhizopus delemar]|nr:hypothetical protein G6F46_014370 [Rhizopus delemar]
MCWSPAVKETLAPGRVSPWIRPPVVVTLPASSKRSWRPALTSTLPGPATCTVLRTTSRPACTTVMSVAVVFIAPMLDTRMSPPARTCTGAERSLQLSRLRVPMALSSVHCPPVLRPTMSPCTA